MLSVQYLVFSITYFALYHFVSVLNTKHSHKKNRFFDFFYESINLYLYQNFHVFHNFISTILHRGIEGLRISGKFNVARPLYRMFADRTVY